MLMTPIATRFKLRLDERYVWFRNEWFFNWHHIGGERAIAIDQFNGRHAHYAGIAFSGSAHDVYWDAIVRGIRKEIVEQLAWVEEAGRPYGRDVAERAIDECAGQLVSFARSVRRTAVEKDRILRGNGIDFPAERDFGHWDSADGPDMIAQADSLKQALFPAPATSQAASPETPLNQPAS